MDNVAGLVLFTAAALLLLLLTRRRQENREGVIPIEETNEHDNGIYVHCIRVISKVSIAITYLRNFRKITALIAKFSNIIIFISVCKQLTIYS